MVVQQDRAADQVNISRKRGCDVDESEIVVTECALALGGFTDRELLFAAQGSSLENAPNAVAAEVGQEMADDEGEVIERRVGRAS